MYVVKKLIKGATPVYWTAKGWDSRRKNAKRWKYEYDAESAADTIQGEDVNAAITVCGL